MRYIQTIYNGVAQSNYCYTRLTRCLYVRNLHIALSELAQSVTLTRK